MCHCEMLVGRAREPGELGPFISDFHSEWVLHTIPTYRSYLMGGLLTLSQVAAERGSRGQSIRSLLLGRDRVEMRRTGADLHGRRNATESWHAELKRRRRRIPVREMAMQSFHLCCMVVTQNAKGCYPSNPVTVVITGGSGSGTGNSSGGSGSGSVSATPTLTSTVQVPGNSTMSQVSTASNLVPLSVLSAEDAATATVVQLTRPVSTDPDTAPSVSVISGAAVAPVAQGLPVSSTFTASVSLADRVGTQLGVTTSDSTGRATVPAFQATQAGVYTISLSDGKGNTYYLKIQVAAATVGRGSAFGR